MTVVQGDAADDQTIAKIVAQAVKEEGRLDVFFANVSCFLNCLADRSIPFNIEFLIGSGTATNSSYNRLELRQEYHYLPICQTRIGNT